LFRQALDDGDIVEVVDPEGRAYYTWREFTKTETKATRSEVKAVGTKVLTSEEYSRIGTLLAEFGWNFDVPSKTLKSTGKPGDDKLSAQALEKLQEALMASRKVAADAKVQLQSIVGQSALSSSALTTKTTLQSQLQQLYNHIEELNHIEVFQCTKDSTSCSPELLRQKLADTAQTLMELYDTNEMAKTWLKNNSK
jgi:hypothetical protein